MGTEANFMTPIYIEQVGVDDVTAEIDEILPEIREQDDFVKPDHWDENHTISTNINDRTDTVKDFNMIKLSHLIENNIVRYMADVQPYGENFIFRGDSWVNINNKGDSQEWHTHGTAYISGVYYHKVPEDSGDLLLKHPVPYIQQGHFPTGKSVGQKVNIKIQSGMIVLFPSWLDHKVEKNKSDDERITFAFNYYRGVKPNE